MNREERNRASRAAMVDSQLIVRGIESPLVLDAMARVPRERFVKPEHQCCAYDDGPLPIGDGQTISQPYIVALMVEALDLEGGERVLDVGTGSGYAAAVLASIAGQVYSIERIASLADQARATLTEQGFDNIEVRCGDGTLGWPEQAPFDGISVAAGAPRVPDVLKQQLTIGGHLVIPVGTGQALQSLLRVTRVSGTEFVTENYGEVRFVPLLGEEGWP